MKKNYLFYLILVSCILHVACGAPAETKETSTCTIEEDPSPTTIPSPTITSQEVVSTPTGSPAPTRTKSPAQTKLHNLSGTLYVADEILVYAYNFQDHKSTLIKSKKTFDFIDICPTKEWLLHVPFSSSVMEIVLVNITTGDEFAIVSQEKAKNVIEYPMSGRNDLLLARLREDRFRVQERWKSGNLFV